MTDTEKLVEERQRLASALIDERVDHAKRYSEAMEMVNHYDLKADAATVALTAAQQEIARLREALEDARREVREMPLNNMQERLVKWRAALIDDLTKALEPSGETR